MYPHWSGDGKKIFYRNGDRFMIVPISTQPLFDPGTPQLLFQTKDIDGFNVFHSTGEFYAVQRVADSGVQARLRLVMNWFPELQRLAPRNKE